MASGIILVFVGTFLTIYAAFSIVSGQKGASGSNLDAILAVVGMVCLALAGALLIRKNIR